MAKKGRSRSAESGSRSSSYSRSDSASDSRSSSGSESESGDSRSPPAKKSVAKAHVEKDVISKKADLPREVEEPTPESTKLHVGCLTRNIHEEHLKEIFGLYGEVLTVELAMDKQVDLPKGFGYVEYQTRAEAEKAQQHMDGGQVDGNVVSVQFVLVPRAPRKRTPPPPPPPSSTRGRDMRERGPLSKDGGLGRRGGSPPARNRRDDGPIRRGESPPRRRQLSPPRRRSRSPVGFRRNRSPARTQVRRGRTPPARHLSPINYRRRSPALRDGARGRRSPPARRMRTRSPPRRGGRSPTPPSRRARSPAGRKGRTPSSESDSEAEKKKPLPAKGKKAASESDKASGSDKSVSGSESD